MTAVTPRTPEITHVLREALASARGGDRVRSHKLFRHLTEFDPSNEAAWLWYANTADDPVEAVRGLRMALKLNPNNAPATTALPTALFRAGVAAAKAKDRGRAVELLADATTRDPMNEGAWLWRAAVCDEPVRTIEYLERALKLNPNNAQAREGVARLRAQLAPAWTCPVCEHAAAFDDTVADVCPRCGVVINLSRPELFDQPSPHLVAETVKAAARHLKSAWTASAQPQAAFGLGLALLNLGYRDDALRALTAAARAAGADPQWRNAVARLTAHRPGRTSQPASVPPAPRAAVMIVDDSPTVRAMVTAVLTDAGYRVTAAGSAEEASRLIRGGNIPQLFILDVNMPGTDGFGLCKVLRAHAETADIPVVFLTGKTGLLSKIHGRWVGAAEYITKPFQNDKLLATVERLTAARI